MGLRMAAVILGMSVLGCDNRRSGDGAVETDPDARRARQLFLDQQQNDERIWRPEMEALNYEASLDALVDRVRGASNRLEELRTLSFGELRFRRPGPTRALGWGVEETPLEGSVVRWDQEEWNAWFDLLVDAQTTVHYFRLRLVRFLPGTKGTNWIDGAVVELECHAKQRPGGETGALISHAVNGELSITWDRPLDESEPVGRMARIEVESLRWRRTVGESGFRETRRYAIGEAGAHQPVRVTPVSVADLDGDHLPEIVLGGVNLVLRNRGAFEFESEPFLEENVNLRRVGALADFTGDGRVDALGFLPDGSSILVLGGPDGRFTETSLQPWAEQVTMPSAVAVADIDGDADLDVWLAQQRPTYHGGMVPTSVSEAHDGFPSRLYRNEGEGRFVEVTAEANLGGQRMRRTTSAKFFDFDGDRDADLLVTSDYAGVELHENQGDGTFRNVTAATFGQWRLLGLCAAVGRFDDDERLDVFAGGRWSIAMHRMDALQLERADFPDMRTTAIQMASGNQLFLSQRDFETGPFSVEAKRTGWTTGAAAADFDNDGDDDLYLTTGHLTGRSVSDFDSQFWRNDVFLNEGVSYRVLQKYFQDPALTPRLTALRKGEISWYGYESNRLEMNGGEDGFVDVGFVHGVGLNQDSPGAVAADLNADGRQDLLTIVQRTFPSEGRLAVEQSLILYENAMPSTGHWFGVRLEPNAPGIQKLSATVRVAGDFGVRERFLISTEASIVQGPVLAHFGLGEYDKVDYLEVRWADGFEQVIVGPEIDRYYTVSPMLDFTPVPDPVPEPVVGDGVVEEVEALVPLDAEVGDS